MRGAFEAAERWSALALKTRSIQALDLTANLDPLFLERRRGPQRARDLSADNGEEALFILALFLFLPYRYGHANQGSKAGKPRA